MFSADLGEQSLAISRDLGDRLEPQVPTLMTSTPSGLFACDSCLVDFDGDGAPDVPISRIPASTATGLQFVLGKVSAFEKSAAPLRQARILLLADTAPLTDDGNVAAYEFTGRLLDYLANRGDSPQAPWRQFLGLAAAVALGLHLPRDHRFVDLFVVCQRQEQRLENRLGGSLRRSVVDVPETESGAHPRFGSCAFAIRSGSAPPRG